MSTKTPHTIGADWLEGKTYPALVVNHWNGWAVPLVDKATAERLVADMAEDAASWDEDTAAEQYRLSWDGDVLVCHAPPALLDEGYEDQRVEVGPDGLYCISFDWCWNDLTGLEVDA